MSEKIFLGFATSLMTGMTVHRYGDLETPNHGAPCKLIFHRGIMGESSLRDCLRAVNGALNGTHDAINLLPSEVDRTLMFSNTRTVNNHGPHSLAGGEYISIDAIQRKDLAVVATKALREMLHMGLVSRADHQLALLKLASVGLEAQPYEGREGRANFESAPASYQPYSGYGLSLHTRADLLSTFNCPTEPAPSARTRTNLPRPR